jgi:hypothetical protein
MLSAMSGMMMRLFGNVEEFITTTRHLQGDQSEEITK